MERTRVAGGGRRKAGKQGRMQGSGFRCESLFKDVYLFFSAFGSFQQQSCDKRTCRGLHTAAHLRAEQMIRHEEYCWMLLMIF